MMHFQYGGVTKNFIFQAPIEVPLWFFVEAIGSPNEIIFNKIKRKSVYILFQAKVKVNRVVGEILSLYIPMHMIDSYG